MKTVYRENYCNAEALEIREREIPVPGENEILVKMKASTVNRTDEGCLLGKPYIFRFFVGYPKPRYHATGTDFSGEVVGKGKSVEKFNIGQVVFGFLDHGLGTHAEYVCIDISKPVFLKPKNISHAQAAAAMEGAHYAFNFINKVKIEAGTKVFVNGATGAIGNAAVQMLNAMGAEVSFTYPTDSYEKISHLKAVKKIDYKKEDFTELSEQYDFVFDAVGKSSFGKCKKLLKEKGVYISSELGPGGENIPLAILGLFQSGKKVIFPFPGSPKHSIPHIISLLEKGDFVPLIDCTYPITEIKEAFKYMLSGEKRGNVVIEF
ncbi:MAG: NAD(P)-dependent alcohol dehydrogenase [Bacteroidetes bacterium]|nr:NAD(P)-dependent alcohol dehydrogenase [Bacteroidota bacterium]